MRRQDFAFDLPPRLIAEYPSEKRSDCRLLHLNGADGALAHRQFSDLQNLLEPGDLLVLNDTKVIPARLYGRKLTGGKVEIMVERVLPDGNLIAQLGASKKVKSGGQILIEAKRADGTEEPQALATATAEPREDGFYQLSFDSHVDLDELLNQAGHTPLPPYIRRSDEALDKERYQTVYADRSGAVAAPTAGLHFDDELLDELRSRGVETACVTLHVGAGTFQPVRVDDIRQHKMHAESVWVSQEVCDKAAEARASGRRIIAVGSTSVRSLETASQSGVLEPYQGDSQLFIYPGYQFRSVDAMITNFHLPESSLLMMVCAFAGYEHVMQAYQQAIDEQYAFFSYGDAMFIEPQHWLGSEAGNTV